jgi:hypothetical protein
MPDGSTTPNTPHTSFDPQKDAGFAIFVTGLGFFSDRADGVPWSFNATDNRNTQFGATVGVLPGIQGGFPPSRQTSTKPRRT